MQSSGKRLVHCAASMPRIVASTFSSDASTFSSDRYLQHQHTESDSTCAIDDWHVGFLWGCFSVVRLHVVIAAAGKPLDSEPLLNQGALKDLAVDGDNGIGHDRLQIW